MAEPLRTHETTGVLTHLQTALFVAGLVLAVASTWLKAAIVLLPGGLCLTGSGLLLLFGVHTAVRGPDGIPLRTAFGSRGVGRLYLRAALWIAIGIAATVVSVLRMA